MLAFEVKSDCPITTDAFCPFANAYAKGATKTLETRSSDRISRPWRAKVSLFLRWAAGELMVLEGKSRESMRLLDGVNKSARIVCPRIAEGI